MYESAVMPEGKRDLRAGDTEEGPACTCGVKEREKRNDSQE